MEGPQKYLSATLWVGSVLAGSAAFFFALFPMSYLIHYLTEKNVKANHHLTHWFEDSRLPLVKSFPDASTAYLLYFLQAPLALGAVAVALRQLLRLPLQHLGKGPDCLTKMMQLASHRAMAVLHRSVRLPRVVQLIGFPSELSGLDLIVFGTFLLLNWWLAGCYVDDRLQFGEGGVGYLQPKFEITPNGIVGKLPNLERTRLFTWVGMENLGLVTGLMSSIMIGWYCIMPVSRRSVFLEMLGVPWEVAIRYHRWIGAHTMFVSLLHTTLYIIVWIKVDSTADYDPDGRVLKTHLWFWGCFDGSCSNEEQRHQAVMMWGFGAVGMMAVMSVAALPYIRRHHYEVFYYLHLLWMPMLVCVQFHFSGGVYFVAPGIAMHCVDKLLASLAWIGSHRAQVQLVAPGLAEVVVRCQAATTMRPGQYVMLNVPSLKVLQWHPLSVTWASDEAFALHVKDAGAWSKGLCELVAQQSELKVKVNGAYGKDVGEEVWNRDVLVLWAGGVGLTYVFSVAELLSRNPSKKAFLRWVVRTEAEHEGFASLLDDLHLRSPNLDLKVWITRPTQLEDGAAGNDGPATPAKFSRSISPSAALARQRTPLLPMSSMVSRWAHACICAVAIYSAFSGIALASDHVTSADDAYEFPNKWYWSMFVWLLYPFVFSVIGAVCAFLVFSPLSILAARLEKRLKQRHSVVESVNPEKPINSNSPTSSKTSVEPTKGGRPDVGADFDAICKQVGECGSGELGVYVAGPNGLVDVVQAECGQRAFAVHCWNLEYEPWEW